MSCKFVVRVVFVNLHEFGVKSLRRKRGRLLLQRERKKDYSPKEYPASTEETTTEGSAEDPPPPEVIPEEDEDDTPEEVDEDNPEKDPAGFAAEEARAAAKYEEELGIVDADEEQEVRAVAKYG